MDKRESKTEKNDDGTMLLWIISVVPEMLPLALASFCVLPSVRFFKLKDHLKMVPSGISPLFDQNIQFFGWHLLQVKMPSSILGSPGSPTTRMSGADRLIG